MRESDMIGYVFNMHKKQIKDFIGDYASVNKEVAFSFLELEKYNLLITKKEISFDDVVEVLRETKNYLFF